ncbi:MAG: hypothetical protein Fur0015_01530 [Ignavibacteriales bacterium]
MVKSFKDLIVWQKAHKLVLKIYGITKEFPLDEKYGLVSQMRRAAVSIPSNIVEGHSRAGRKEFLNFLSIANGSLSELKYQILLCKDLNFINDTDFDSLEKDIEEISKILFSFSKSLKESSLKH